MASIFGDTNDLFEDNLDFQPSDTEENQGADDKEMDEGDPSTSKSVKVEPKKRTVRNPRPRLNIDTLRGPRGVQTIEHYFQDINYKGKGFEKHDLDDVMRRLQHWAHRMYPTYKFDDVLTNIERLGKKKPLQVHMSRYRLGLLEDLPKNDEINDEDGQNLSGIKQLEDEPFDEFDALLGEQIAISEKTLRPTLVQNNSNFEDLSTSSDITYATNSLKGVTDETDGLVLGQVLPKSKTTVQLSAEQMARIAENRRIAQERLQAKRLQQANL